MAPAAPVTTAISLVFFVSNSMLPFQLGAGGYKQKQFFFEKKNQKTFVPLRVAPPRYSW
jgi:hypothetical protein